MTQKQHDGIIDTCAAIAQEMSEKPGALLPILHRIQDTFTYIPQQAVAVIAKTLALSRAEVHGVISFYEHFRTTKPGKRTLYVCRAEACQSMGGRQIEEYAKSALNVDWHQTTADQSISLEPIYCLGNCACAPAVMLDEQVVGKVTKDRLDVLLSQINSGEAK